MVDENHNADENGGSSYNKKAPRPRLNPMQLRRLKKKKKICKNKTISLDDDNQLPYPSAKKPAASGSSNLSSRMDALYMQSKSQVSHYNNNHDVGDGRGTSSTTKLAPIRHYDADFFSSNATSSIDKNLKSKAVVLSNFSLESIKRPSIINIPSSPPSIKQYWNDALLFYSLSCNNNTTSLLLPQWQEGFRSLYYKWRQAHQYDDQQQQQSFDFYLVGKSSNVTICFSSERVAYVSRSNIKLRKLLEHNDIIFSTPLVTSASNKTEDDASLLKELKELDSVYTSSTNNDTAVIPNDQSLLVIENDEYSLHALFDLVLNLKVQSMLSPDKSSSELYDIISPVSFTLASLKKCSVQNYHVSEGNETTWRIEITSNNFVLPCILSRVCTVLRMLTNEDDTDALFRVFCTNTSNSNSAVISMDNASCCCFTEVQYNHRENLQGFRIKTN